LSTRQLFKNNVNVALAAGITNVAVSCTVAAGLGTLFGAVAAGEHIMGTIVDDTTAYEIVKITAVAGDALTIARAQESTAARTFNIANNPKIGIRLTAGTLERLTQKDADETISGNWAFSDGGARLGNLQVFTTPGANTYTPTTGMKFCVVELVGGGGGGGSGNTVDGACGGGGGGGGSAIKKISAATIGASQVATVGAAGAASGLTTSGGTGGTSSLGALVSATGGVGGAENPSATATVAGGAGGAGASGDINFTGQAGGAGAADAVAGGFGGSSRMGGGGGGTQFGGGAGSNYGGGGAGSRRSSGNNRAGAAGAQGIVYIWEYF
jgi:hypothetical protein